MSPEFPQAPEERYLSVVQAFHTAEQCLREQGHTFVYRRDGEIIEMTPEHPKYWQGYEKPE